MNIEVDNLTKAEALKVINRMIRERSCSYVVTPNVDHIVQLEHDKELQQIYKEADLILTDGKPLIWISRLYKTPIKEKVSGADLFPALCRLAVNRGYSIFLLGAAEGVAEKAKENLQKKFRGLDIAGVYSPPYGFEKDENEIQEIIRRVKEVSPDILIVGLGCPKQEKFIYRYKDRLNVPLSLGLGASIDFAAGKVKRAPKWMRKHGLEWLYRITQDPSRLTGRYIEDARRIIPIVFKYRNVG